MEREARRAETTGEQRNAISEGIVALLKDFYGVGPTHAKTYLYEDLVVVLLRGGFTRVEQTLWENGRTGAVIEQRMAFQEVMRDRFVSVVEEATGRKVMGFMSGNQQDPDMISEVFVLDGTDMVGEDVPERLPPPRSDQA